MLTPSRLARHLAASLPHREPLYMPARRRPLAPIRPWAPPQRAHAVPLPHPPAPPPPALAPAAGPCQRRRTPWRAARPPPHPRHTHPALFPAHALPLRQGAGTSFERPPNTTRTTPRAAAAPATCRREPPPGARARPRTAQLCGASARMRRRRARRSAFTVLVAPLHPKLARAATHDVMRLLAGADLGARLGPAQRLGPRPCVTVRGHLPSARTASSAHARSACRRHGGAQSGAAQRRPGLAQQAASRQERPKALCFVTRSEAFGNYRLRRSLREPAGRGARTAARAPPPVPVTHNSSAPYAPARTRRGN